MTIRPFRQLVGYAASFREDNVDTDVIYPARFLLITARQGLGRYAFHDRRFTPEGVEIADFVLNRAPGRDAVILVTGANFGSGSSREQAVWALLGQGIRCLIGRSFGEIFFNNCLRNGVLPIVLPDAAVERLATAADAGLTFTVDLETRTIAVPDGAAVFFEIDEEQRQALLNGWDETAIILNTYGGHLDDFETRQRDVQPWLYDEEPAP